MKRFKNNRSEQKLNPIERLYWCMEKKRLYIGACMANGNMYNGFEWATFCEGGISHHFQNREKLVSIYDIMKSFECNNIEEEAKLFENIATLYHSNNDESFQLALQMIEGAVERIFQKTN